MKYLLAILVIVHSVPAYAQTIITDPGSYGGGDFKLGADVVVDRGNGLVFTETANLDLNGFTIKTNQTGNPWDFGIIMNGPSSTVSNGNVNGFRVGAKFSGAASASYNVNYSRSRYIGVLIEADDVAVTGGVIGEIGGVSDELYAIGVQCNARKCDVSGVTFNNIYPQKDYRGSEAGEGLAVNFSASSDSGRLSACSFSNEEYLGHTTGVFAAGGGNHRIEGFTLRNVFLPVQISLKAPASTVRGTNSIYDFVTPQ